MGAISLFVTIFLNAVCCSDVKTRHYEICWWSSSIQRTRWIYPLLFVYVLMAKLQCTLGAISRWTNPIINGAIGSGNLLPHVLEDTYGRTGIYVETDEPDVSYYIVFQEVDNLFNCNETSGEITIANGVATLDLETGPNIYKLIIWARGINDSEGTATATIILRDLNDNVPTFDQSEYSVVVKGGAVGGTRVTTVSATDGDVTSPNNVVSYSITAGNSDRLFYIDQNSGQITVRLGKTINTTMTISYRLTIMAVDQGRPPRTGSTTINVSVGKAERLHQGGRLGLLIFIMFIALFI